MDIVLTYSGSKRLKYLLRNIHYLKHNFPSHNLTLIVDDQRSFNFYSKHVNCVLAENPSPNMKSLFSKLSHDETFWDGFWYRTLKRFFMLEEFLRKTPKTPILHIESDVLLLPNFPFDDFRQITNGLAFPVISEDLGVASVLYIPELKHLTEFLDFCHDISQNSPRETDMTLLAKFAKFSRNALVLPTLLGSQIKLLGQQSLELRSEFTNQKLFRGLFDGATYGQFLFGIDPRNNLGRRSLFIQYAHHFAKPRVMQFCLANQKSGFSLQIGIQDDTTYPLYCLHIHSKDLRVFDIESLKVRKIINKRIYQAKKGEIKNEYVFKLFISEFSSFGRAIIHKLLHFLDS